MNECTLRLEWHCAITVIYHVTMLCQLYCSYIASSYHLAAICNACFFGATSLISAFFGRWTPNAVTGIAVVIDKSNRSFIVNQNTIFPSKVEYKYNFPNELSIPINWVRKQNLFWHFLRFVLALWTASRSLPVLWHAVSTSLASQEFLSTALNSFVLSTANKKHKGT